VRQSYISYTIDISLILNLKHQLLTHGNNFEQLKGLLKQLFLISILVI